VLIGLTGPHPRSTSAMSTGANGVHLRGNAHPHRPRPISIATTGVMSASMFEKGARHNGQITPGQAPTNSFKSELFLLTTLYYFLNI